MSDKGYILVVEDDQFLAEAMQDHLQTLEYKSEVCATGEEAVRICRKSAPDGILMDVQLAGDLDGIDSIREVRSFCHMPVIFLTANESDEVYQRCHAIADSFMLPKPVTFIQLKRLVQQVFVHKTEQNTFRSVTEEESGLNDSVFLKSERGKEVHHRIKLSEITHLNSGRAYCYIVLTNDKKITYSKPLNKVLELISRKEGGEKFTRIHNSHAVNKDHITGYEGNEVILAHTIRLPIGPSYREDIKKLLS
ncbi:MAG: response regulator [Cyclobacteriaceae bacterium]